MIRLRPTDKRDHGDATLAPDGPPPPQGRGRISEHESWRRALVVVLVSPLPEYSQDTQRFGAASFALSDDDDIAPLVASVGRRRADMGSTTQLITQGLRDVAEYTDLFDYPSWGIDLARRGSTVLKYYYNK